MRFINPILFILLVSQANAVMINGGINFLFMGNSVTDYENTTLDYDFSSLIDTKYSLSTRQTLFYVHGWESNLQTNVNNDVISAAIAAQDWNVVFIDWSKYAINLNYFEVASSINDQASFIVQTLIQIKNAGIDVSNAYFVGHSLGAQMLGRIGAQWQKNMNEVLPRITGLDPATVSFSPYLVDWPQNRAKTYPSINKNAASCVDILHTGGNLQGISYPAGHIDSFANGGRNQPLCNLCWLHNENCITCSHNRAIKIFQESISSGSVRKFKSYKCPGNVYNAAVCTGSVISTGRYACEYFDTPGNYYFATNGLSPYSKEDVK